MPKRIGDVDLFEFDYAVNSSTIPMPINTDGYNVFDRDVFESLVKAVPRRGGVVINDVRIKRTSGGYDASVTWRYPNSPYTCVTNYWGDGIYYLTGITTDKTVVRIMFDTHCISSNIEDFGDMMADELLACLRKEEEYSHIAAGLGNMKRLNRLPEKVNRFTLLQERADLIKKRQNAIEKKKVAFGSGVKLWDRAIEKYQEELWDNKCLLRLVKE